jgi:N-acetylneuraminate synthase
MPSIQLGTRRVDRASRPYVIAEIGVNHEGSLDTAKRLVDLAREGGADAAKFQTYKAHKIASRHSPAYWDLSKEPTASQFTLFQKHDRFGEAEYLALAAHCAGIGIDFLSTPFDADAVEFLAPLMPFFKIASADLTNVPMLRQIAGKGKPVALSTGASTLAEIDLAVDELLRHGAPEIALLHCVLNYPTPYENAHLNMIDGLIRAYPQFVVGYSDHTLPDPAMAVLTAAYVKGARVIEKHFTHDKSLPGNDHYHAMDVVDLGRFTANIDLLKRAEGSDLKAPLDSERISRANARRSIVLARPMRAGQPVTEADITYKRPGTGISPLHWDEVLGMRARSDMEEDRVLHWADLLPAE